MQNKQKSLLMGKDKKKIKDWSISILYKVQYPSNRNSRNKTENQKNILLRKYIIKEINQEIFPDLKMPFQTERPPTQCMKINPYQKTPL